MRRCGLRSIIILLAIAIVSATAFGITAEPRPMHAQRRVTRIQINDFALTDQNSTPFEFKNLAGKVVVVAFAYTTCPDVCPLITASLRQVQSGLTKEERKHVRLMTVTTDPEIDSPKVLTAYAKRYGAEFDNWSFLTGNLTALKKIWQNFGVGVERKGRGLDPKAVLADVRAMLREH